MTPTAIAALSVQAARRQRLAQDLARITGLSIAAVRGRLARAHGRTLLRNLFSDVWHLAPQRPAVTPRNSAPRTARTIHRVRQEFSTSCGVAVVAMFARVSHKNAMELMFPDPGRAFYTHLRDIKRALDHFGVPYGSRWHRFRSWNEIPTTSLVKVEWQAEGRRGLHWVIFQRKLDGGWCIIDPDPPRGNGTQRLSRDELREYRAITYLPVDARVPANAEE